MANTFKIPLLNPFRFVNTNPNIDPRYNSAPFEYEVDQNSYFQKWQTNDRTKIQLFSDFNDVSLDFYTCDDVFFLNVPLNPIDSGILGETFTVYEAEIDFSMFPENVYYGVVSYTDENETLQYWQTSPLDILDYWANTLLYEYRNTYNDKGIVFELGLIFTLRIEGLIREYQPSSADEEYVDQYYNGVQLNSIPYRIFTNYIGLAKGLPDWIIDKMNFIFSVNEVQINGTYFGKADGAKFDMTRPTNGKNEAGFMSIKVIQNDNFFLQQFKLGDTPIGELKVIKKAITYKDNAANIAVAGVFKTFSNLIRIAIVNLSLEAFVLRIGTSNGGDEIGTFDVPEDATCSLNMEHYFSASQTTYLTADAWPNCHVTLDYNQYDAPELNDNDDTDVKFGNNILYTYYEKEIGDFDVHWNVITGLGREDTPFFGCALMDGQNDTIDLANRFLIGFDKAIPANRQTFIGAVNNKINLTVGQLPPHNHGYDAVTTRLEWDDGGRFQNYKTPGSAATVNTGNGDPIDITPRSLVVAYFIKISA